MKNSKIGLLLLALFISFSATASIPNVWGDDIRGTRDNDNLRGTPDEDLLIGFGGTDQLTGVEGNDLIYGDADPQSANISSLGADGDDELFAGEGNDRLFGGMGDEQEMAGGDGDDDLYGEAGNDFMEGEGGNDLIVGGVGDDRMLGGSGADKFDCGYGNDRVSDFDESEGDRIFTVRGDLGICEDYSCPDGFARTTRVEGENQFQTCIDERTEFGAMNASERMDSQKSAGSGQEEPDDEQQITPDDMPQTDGEKSSGETIEK